MILNYTLVCPTFCLCATKLDYFLKCNTLYAYILYIIAFLKSAFIFSVSKMTVKLNSCFKNVIIYRVFI